MFIMTLENGMAVMAGKGVVGGGGCRGWWGRRGAVGVGGVWGGGLFWGRLGGRGHSVPFHAHVGKCILLTFIISEKGKGSRLLSHLGHKPLSLFRFTEI